MLLGASGTIGRATALALKDCGHDVICPTRAELPFLDLTWVEVVVSCMASRTGAPKDAWAVDCQAHRDVLNICQRDGVAMFVLLSAICVQRPKLEFQRAKLAFEAELIASGLTCSIVRPTAYFKSLTGQIERLRAGKPYLMFGDGELTACKPISNRDLGVFLASCVSDTTRQNKILPIGGPGPEVTPKDIGKMLFRLLDQSPKYRRVPPGFLGLVAKALSLVGMKDKAEFARTGHYYGTESMLVWKNGSYNADATPEFGQDRLEDYARALIEGEIADERGAQSVF